MKNNKQGCDLQSCFFCRHCLPEWIPAIEGNKTTLYFKKGQAIFTEGEEVKGMFFVYHGTVKVHKKWGKEKELIIRFAKDGDIIGHRGLGDETIYPVTGTALENTTVCYIDLEFFKTSIRINNDFTIRLLMFYADELQRSERKMNNLAHMQVKGRVAFCLLSLKTKFGTDSEGAINIFLTRQDLASYAGTTYETVFRILNEMVTENIVAIHNKHIAVLDEERLIHFTRQHDDT